mmetsp:Transcript_44953/g.95840  ORF Transcript_44953/g.95840 Transcript_44953/m.95840 type:complete len:356 (-) Transcript_44953:1525-2592(-)
MPDIAVVAVAAELVVREFVTDQRASVALLRGIRRDGRLALPTHEPQASGASGGDVVHQLSVEYGPSPGPLFALYVDIGARVSAAEAERGDPRASRIEAGVYALRLEQLWEALGLQVRIQGLDVHVGRRHRTHHEDNALQQASDARCRLQVTDVALCAGVGQGVVALPLHDRHDGTDLDGISEGSSCAVAFHSRDMLSVDSAHLQRVPDNRLLRRTVWRSQARAPSILVGTRADQGSQSVLNLIKVVSDVHVKHTSTLPTLIAISGAVVCEGAPNVTEHARRTIPNVTNRSNAIGTTANSSVARLAPYFPIDHAHVRMVGRNQGCRACSVESHGGALHVEDIRHPGWHKCAADSSG